MCRIVACQTLVVACAALLLAGCSGSSPGEIADATDSAVDIQLPDSVQATPAAVDSEPPAALTELSPSANVAEGSDSDTPGAYSPPADTVAEESHDHAHGAADHAHEDAPKRNGRQPDGDDPDAPLVAAKPVKQQAAAPLNNGRQASAKPLPEGQRIADAPSAPVDSLADGRTQNAQPGDEPPVAQDAQPAGKPAAPTRAKLADLSASVQALDKDGDGQLGLYEWPREKVAEFNTLDENKDGFLTPAELVAGQKRAAAATSNDAEAESDSQAATSSDAAESQDDSAETSADEKPTETEASNDQSGDEEDTSETEAGDAEQAAADSSADEADGQDGSTADDQAE